jgi:hypothetical protein
VLRVGWHVVVPLVLNLIPAFLFLVVAPQLFGFSLPGMIYGAPDLGYVMVVSGGVALGWSVLRTVLAFFTLRTPGAPRAAEAVEAPVAA